MRDARRRDAREGVIERKAGAIECLAHQVGRFRIEYAVLELGKNGGHRGPPFAMGPQTRLSSTSFEKAGPEPGRVGRPSGSYLTVPLAAIAGIEREPLGDVCLPPPLDA
jgi:hypothetical protein